MSEELGVSIYIAIGVVFFLLGLYQIKKADKDGRRSRSPTSTDSLIMQWLLISMIWAPAIVFIIFMYFEERPSRKRDKQFSRSVIDKYGTPTNQEEVSWSINEHGLKYVRLRDNMYLVKFTKEGDITIVKNHYSGYNLLELKK